MAIDPAIRNHKAWLGYLQPDGLVVSAAALVDAQVLIEKNPAPLQRRFLEFVEEVEREDSSVPAIVDLPAFLAGFLEWPANCIVGGDGQRPVPEELRVPLRNFGETLEPDLAFRNPKPGEGAPPWMLLVQEFPVGTDLDAAVESVEAGWSASRTRRFERLLREASVPVGLLSNGTHFRLIYAPQGENAGTLTFPVAAMAEVAGRPILSAFETLLSKERLLTAPSEARLPALLQKSRDYQGRVSTQLAQQVLDALYEMLRGFEAANAHANGELLKDTLKGKPDDVYWGLLTVLMRLVFLLYAEDRGLMPGSDLYVRNYSVHGLFQQLRSDAEQYPDTMDHRYGAWAQLLALFRVVHDGCEHKLMKMPKRHGHLFDPDRFPFLDGRTVPEGRLPLVSDGVVCRVLGNLLSLGGERLSYRTLDVEQIGSVYETMMGFRLERAEGQTIALKPAKAHGAPVPVSLDSLMQTAPAQRAKWVADRTDYKPTPAMTNDVKSAESADALLAALERRIARNATPHPVPAGTMVLVPTDERRKTGSHYTPRSLTEPIVRKTLEPVLAQLGEHPTPDQILDLKVCDPAMGSGAFLVEACRQLGDALVEAWTYYKWKPFIPEDETEELHARRLVAQRCLYGVDRNPMAVDLAKLSLWLATLARDHPFTFLDHAFRTGDSLVGLTRKQIAGFHWAPPKQLTFLADFVQKKLASVSRERRQILQAGDDMPPAAKRQRLGVADEALHPARLLGDAVVAAFFAAQKAKQREDKRAELFALAENLHVSNDLSALLPLGKAVDSLRSGAQPVLPFHWEIEFPEVFDEGGGFHVIVGNPPFMGGGKISGTFGHEYLDWIKAIHPDSHGNADLVAHFFRRAFDLIREEAAFGLIASNTIGQGDTRSTGLRYICTNGGSIYCARRRYKWPGEAAVVVSVVHVFKGAMSGPLLLDDCKVPAITAYLFHAGTHENPDPLEANADIVFNGVKIYGQGFLFDDTDISGASSSIAEMQRLIAQNFQNQERIRPYVGGEEVNAHPMQKHHRFVISFEDWPLRRADLGGSWFNASEKQREQWLRNGVVPNDYPDPVATDWPDLLHIVEHKVKPERMLLKMGTDGGRLRKYWWRFGRPRPELYCAIGSLDRVVVNSQVSQYISFAFLPSTWVFSHALNIFAIFSNNLFCILQSHLHEIWARFFASSLEERLRYTPTDCFETFPFPPKYESNATLEAAGREYYEFRADLMVRNDEGLTKTYNRFHNPAEASADIAKLRELHNAMDRAVLDAYGWGDVAPAVGFGLDYLDADDEEALPGDAPAQLWWPTAADAAAFEAKLPPTRRRRPWRCRWPDETRDEVLARLLALNAERAEEERRRGQVKQAAEKKRAKRKRAK